jgi:UDP-4-amino-4,6-dideoxy-N-acetyl-beta-L-altrosamine transaminase
MIKPIPYGRQNITEEDIQAVIEVLRSDFLTQGPAINAFEDAFAKYVGAKYCVAVSNGTAALHIAVACLEIEKGKEGVTSPNSFLASANCMVYNNIKPSFADINSITYCVDSKSILNAINKNTSLLIPVHFAGQPCEMHEIATVGKENDLFIIEDAAHAIGSRYADGSFVGNCKYSDLTIFSFHPVKTITTGEGGAITTNNKQLYERLLMLRSHGMTNDPNVLNINPGPWYYEMHELGFNYRMTDIQAALGIQQLRKLDAFVSRRREIIKQYNKAFNIIDWLTVPFEKTEGYSAFHLYVLKFDFEKIGKNRKQVMEELLKNGIGTQVHYIPIHTQPYYQINYGFRFGDFPNAENYYQNVVSIPLYPAMTDAECEYVINKILSLKNRT